MSEMILAMTSLVILLVACSGLPTPVSGQIQNAATNRQNGNTGQRRTDDVPAAYYWDKKTDGTNVGGHSQTGHVNRRSKRAFLTAAGLFFRRWKQIISNAELKCCSRTFIKAYQKNGDYKTALADFEYLRPTHVEEVFQNGVFGKFGRVNDWSVMVFPEEMFGMKGSTTLKLVHKDTKQKVRSIIYQKPNQR